MEYKKVVEAIQIIQEYCDKTNCLRCFLCEAGFCRKNFSVQPYHWNIQGEKTK